MQMMLDGEIDTGEYLGINQDMNRANTTLLKERESLETDKIDSASKINGSFNFLRHVRKFYAEANVEIKQKLVGLILHEKLIFENNRVQTQR
jgi:hypothetical protein